MIPGPALAGDLLALGHVDDVDRRVDQLGAEGGGEIVAAALHEHQLEPGKARQEILDRLQVHRGVLANRRVRAAARLHADHAPRRAGRPGA